MRNLSSIILSFGFITSLLAQNPHGANLKIDCAACHSSKGWEISAAWWQSFDPDKPMISRNTGMVWGLDTIRFHHGKTDYPLLGRHATVDCRGCHENLVFSEAPSDCIFCHNDVHQQTVGADCARCHTPANWLVDNVTDLHLQNGFPVTGVHQAVSCEECHRSASNLQFNRLGNDCIDCHLQDYNAATSPNHRQMGFSTNCVECHNVFTPGWGTDKVNHDFFPLTKGHDIADCMKCHVNGEFSNTPTSCNACHQADFAAAQSPNHVSAQFSNDCAQCHTTEPDWMPAKYLEHDAAYFPIYSGKHNGQWMQCTECHTDPSNFAVFSCTVCHLNPETNDAHNGISGYTYDSPACLACHPTGSADDAFNHDLTNFPLTGAHIGVACIECHAAGYAGTSTQCSSCHTTDFNQATNPSHVQLNIPTDCAMCHTTAPGWEPATFPIHNNYYALNGAHAAIAQDCATCHNGNYNNTPNTCNGCHAADYNQTTDPNHASQQFSTDCATCHSETAWAPATFDHNTVYPFTGAHTAIASDCNACHHGNYTNTPNTCNGCHAADYAQSTNPNHGTLNIPTDCAMCHTTAPGWEPATFPIHNNYYTLNGAHAVIANDCATCHNGNYNNTPNTCNGCHATDYAQTTNPNHANLQFSTDCTTCHTETAWAPATFNHDAQYFPIYSGKHNGEWTSCADCHTNPSNYAEFTCTNCHTNPQTNNDHNGVNGYTYNSSACLACHPTGNAADGFDHNTTNFPLTGAHLAAACLDCHAGGYAGTPTQCAACHTTDFNQSSNPNHVALNLPTDCAMCHTTAPNWAPASFPIHNNYWALHGAHAAISNDCNACHNGNYNNTPNTCFGCHAADYNSATNPNHAAAGFPTTCQTCHTETAWDPSTFNHDQQYFPIYSGKHKNEWDQCVECHTIPGNFTSFSCIDCHEHNNPSSLAQHHQGVQGYQYVSSACYNCHPDGHN